MRNHSRVSPSNRTLSAVISLMILLGSLCAVVTGGMVC